MFIPIPIYIPIFLAIPILILFSVIVRPFHHHHCPSLSITVLIPTLSSHPFRPVPLSRSSYYPEPDDGTCPVPTPSQSNPPTLPESSSSPYLQPHPDPLLNHTRRFPYSSLSLSPHRFLASSSTRILQRIRVAGSVLGVRELSDRYPPELQDNDRSNL